MTTRRRIDWHWHTDLLAKASYGSYEANSFIFIRLNSARILTFFKVTINNRTDNHSIKIAVISKHDYNPQGQ